MKAGRQAGRQAGRRLAADSVSTSHIHVPGEFFALLRVRVESIALFFERPHARLACPERLFLI